jgi:type II secretory pathway component GspD/PulD (secretin)
VTPSIGADLSTINLTLISDITELQNKSEWETANTPGAQDPNGNPIVQTVGKLPIVKQKKIETEMVVRSGETVVMGGLATPSGGKGSKGLPWLADLPWLGLLFRKDHVNEDPANLLIFVTATIIADTGEELIPLNPPDLPGLPVAPGLR